MEHFSLDKIYLYIRIIFILCCCALSVQLFLWVELLREITETQSVKVSTTLDGLNASVVEVKASMEALRRSSEATEGFARLQFDKLNDPKTQESIGIGLRSLRELGPIANNLRTITSEAKPIPGAILGLLADCRHAIIQTNDNTQLVLQSTDLAVRDIHRILSNPAYEEALSKLPPLLDNIGVTITHVDASQAEVLSALTDLLIGLKSTVAEGENSVAEVTRLLQRINQPLSKKEKLINILLRVILPLGASAIDLSRR